MLSATFYSFKGGVGRTLALLNVARILASTHRRVVVVDLDLEAPGFELTGLLGDPTVPRPGISDYMLERRAGDDSAVDRYCHPSTLEGIGDRLVFVPAGTRPTELAHLVSQLYADPAGDSAGLFQLFAAEIEQQVGPHYLLFDSRTGLADIAGVCTVELPDVLVAIAGLSHQNLLGMERVLAQLRSHPARRKQVATLVVLSPVPTDRQVGVPLGRERAILARELQQTYTDVPDEVPLREDATGQVSPLYARLLDAERRLCLPVRREFVSRVQPYFPWLAVEDLRHQIPHHPDLMIRDESDLSAPPELEQCYRWLAHALTRAHPDDEPLDAELPSTTWFTP